MAYIGLDIGTSGCKASVVTKEAKILATAHAEYELKYPEKGYVELDPNEIYEKVKEVLKKLAPMSNDVTSLSLSSFGEAFVLLDETGIPLCNFITYADNRCAGIDKQLLKQFSAKKFFDITGVVPNQSFSLCKLLWLRKHQPNLIKRTHSIFLANDYYNYLLTGNRAVDYGTASKTLLFDIHKEDWSEELLQEFDFPRKWFSPVKRVGTLLGKLRAELAKELGLHEDLLIYLGCHDQCSATLGGGVFSPYSAMIGEGSTESINLIVDSSVFEHSEELIKHKLCVEPFVTENHYILPAAILTYGNSIRWYLNTIETGIVKNVPEDKTVFDFLEENSREETELIFLPHLSGVNIMEPDSKVPGGFLGITLETKRWELYRAVMQGLNFETKINFDLLRKLGLSIQALSATGGITNSSLFMQLKADTLQMKIQILDNSEAGIIGLAMVCAVAEGDYDDYTTAIKQFVSIRKEFNPEKNYSKLFKQYKKIRQKLK